MADLLPADKPIVDPASSGSPARDTTPSNQGGTGASTSGDWFKAQDADFTELVSKKGWKSPHEALKSYSELEPVYGRTLNELNELKTTVGQIAPYWPQFIAYLEAEQAKSEAQQKPSGKQPGGIDPNKLLQPVNEKLSEQDERSKRMAISFASRNFLRENPEAQKVKAQIIQVIEKGRVNVSDIFDPESYYEALGTAWQIVKAENADKAERGKKAQGGVSGSGVSPTAAGFEAGMPLDKLKELIMAGEKP